MDYQNTFRRCLLQAIGETVFDVIYLSTVITLGILMMIKGKGQKAFFLFGVMAVTLGCDDAFHLVPRALALCTPGLESYPLWLGAGKWITSVTMTVFYVILYYVWRIRYRITGAAKTTIAVYALAAIRIALCFSPKTNGSVQTHR